MTNNNQHDDDRYQRRQQARASKQTARELPWIVWLNGKEYGRYASHNEVRRISAALAKQHPNATITQRYFGRSISHDTRSRNDG